MLLVQVLQPLICFVTVFYGGGGWGRGYGGGRFGGFGGFGRRGFGGFKGGYYG
jgi:hypothetical protein